MADNDPGWVAQVKAIFDGAGVPVYIWFPLLAHESNGYPAVVNDTRDKTDFAPGTRSEFSVGLFQINVHAMGLTRAEEDALAAKLKDPVENAKWIAPKIAAAWNYVKANKTAVAAKDGLPAEYGLSGAVAVRAGFPGGHPEGVADGPCITPYCRDVEKQFAETERQLNSVWNAWSASGKPMQWLIPWWTRGSTPSIYGGGNAGGSGNASGSSSAGAGSASGGGGGGITNTGSSGGAAGSSPTTTSAVAQISDYLATDDHAARIVVFAIGAGLALLALAAILFEGGKKAAPVVVKAAEAAAVL